MSLTLSARDAARLLKGQAATTTTTTDRAPRRAPDRATTNHDALLARAADRGWWLIGSIDSLTYYAHHRDGREERGEYSDLLRRIGGAR